MIYEVWIKNGIDLDYFSSREAAEMYIEKYIKRRELVCKMTRDEFEIRVKEEKGPVVNPNRKFPDPRPWW